MYVYILVTGLGFLGGCRFLGVFFVVVVVFGGGG